MDMGQWTLCTLNTFCLDWFFLQKYCRNCMNLGAVISCMAPDYLMARFPKCVNFHIWHVLLLPGGCRFVLLPNKEPSIFVLKLDLHCKTKVHTQHSTFCGKVSIEKKCPFVFLKTQVMTVFKVEQKKKKKVFRNLVPPDTPPDVRCCNTPGNCSQSKRGKVRNGRKTPTSAPVGDQETPELFVC